MQLIDSKLEATLVVSVVALGLLLGACGAGGGSSATSGPPASTANPPQQNGANGTQTPVPAESAPPGDIPDSTAFVPYVSAAGHFGLTVPEGWARRTKASEVIFTSKLNQVEARWGHATSSQKEIKSLQRTAQAFQLEKTSKVTLPGGPATLIQYQENSKPNAVTGQQYRLERLQFDFARGSREVALTLSSTVGSDNVDAWRTISESFRWK